MARGKCLSLEEARKSKKIDRFCKEHPSEGDEELFDRLLDVMSRPKRKGNNTEELQVPLYYILPPSEDKP